ncbi:MULTISPECIES: DUF305 domain-containing protein [Dyadobacter]|uniref:DUF305 domain-containing protein n=2 Tax=Dyadobacter TaxID=120831 RepID=A0A5R9K6G8_9BACT|nr:MULTISPECIES: DUF305 domain-containing protein [Dyadobacter]TLU89372.1 DUF305 domain-containing protein [Dyadobacter sediminis]SKC20478.1 Uncharacterized conserved protein, DUF305 family [Dyadobacter psychrophilus]
MKTSIIFTSIFVALALCHASAFVADDLHQSMSKMMQKMKSMKMTGDVDKDFANMMIEHHQGAIDAANVVLKSGKDPKINAIAKKIVAEQPKDQQNLRLHISAEHKTNAEKGSEHATHGNNPISAPPSKGNQFTNEMKNILNQMDLKMKNMNMTANVDHDFASMMIDHHKVATDMAQAETKYGKVVEVKLLAKKIMSDSQKEISELQKWMNGHHK